MPTDWVCLIGGNKNDLIQSISPLSTMVLAHTYPQTYEQIPCEISVNNPRTECPLCITPCLKSRRGMFSFMTYMSDLWFYMKFKGLVGGSRVGLSRGGVGLLHRAGTTPRAVLAVSGRVGTACQPSMPGRRWTGLARGRGTICRALPGKEGAAKPRPDPRQRQLAPRKSARPPPNP